MTPSIRKVLLLNPPGDRLYIRDQFCSHVSKGTYYWQPLDLLQISARLHAEGYQLAVIDAIAEHLSPNEAHSRIAAFNPDAVVFLVGSDTVLDDLAFVAEVKRRGVSVAVAIGDVMREKGETLLAEHPHLDAAMTDFVTHGLPAFLQGRLDDAENMIVRGDAAARRVPEKKRDGKIFKLGTPRYELFPLDRYRMPYNKYHPYATLITASWCPFGCSFCPFANTPYKMRDVNDVLENLEHIRRMGIRQVHIADWTFAVNKKHARAILQGMIERKFNFTWSCLSRVDVVDFELLSLMKQTGCEMIEFGVESGNQAILNRYEKDTTLEEIRRAFRWARELELTTLATFVLGLPGDTQQTMEETLKLAMEIEPTYCSFNAASPRMATELRHDMVSSGMIADNIGVALDSSRSLPVFSTAQLSAAEVSAFRQKAIRKFYLRPSYVLRRAAKMRSWEEVQNHVRNGLSVARQSLHL